MGSKLRGRIAGHGIHEKYTLGSCVGVQAPPLSLANQLPPLSPFTLNLTFVNIIRFLLQGEPTYVVGSVPNCPPAPAILHSYIDRSENS